MDGHHRGAHTLEERDTMLVRGGQSFIAAPFRAHPRRPVLRILHRRWGSLAFEQAAQYVGHVFIGKLKVWRVGHADAKNISHKM
jgi:hypothetical protein